MARTVTFIIDGTLDQQTGGYIYDRFVVEGLRASGVRVDVVNLETRGTRGAFESVRVSMLLSRASQGDVVVVDELCHPRVTLPALLHRTRSRTSRPKVVVVVHHLAADEKGGLERRARLVVERALLACADKIVVTSETTRLRLEKLGSRADQLVVVPPGRDRLGGRVEATGPGEPPRLLFLGSLTPRKNPLSLLRAIVAMRREATVTLVGPTDRDPAYAAAVMEYVRQSGCRAQITGPLPDAAVADQLAQHDVLVLPSRYEGYGIAIAEALSFGLAVVSTRVGAIPEVVRDGEEAILVPPDDDRALEAALQALFRDPGRLSAMKVKALERSRALPTWRETQASFSRAISEVG